MDLEQTMQTLEKMGTAQNRALYARHGVADPTFGVSAADLAALKKRLQVNHALALELWATGNHDARRLATLIADADALSAQTLDAWARTVSDPITADAFAKLAARAKHARKKAARWVKLKPEYVARSGWNIIALLAMHDRALPATFFQDYLELIAATFAARPACVQEAMHAALIAIGVRSADLEHDALETAARIGHIPNARGAANYKMPDAAQTILKTVARKGFVITPPS